MRSRNLQKLVIFSLALKVRRNPGLAALRRSLSPHEKQAITLIVYLSTRVFPSNGDLWLPGLPLSISEWLGYRPGSEIITSPGASPHEPTHYLPRRCKSFPDPSS